jgi:uncharacterized membrane protein YoaK (UPF0700 family)
MEPTASFVATESGRLAPGRGLTPLRLACVAGLWGVIGFIHAGGASLPVVWTATMVAAGLGLAIVLLDAQDTCWTSVLAAAVLLATSPFLQKYWLMPREEPAWDTLTFLKSILIVGGLLLLARLEAGSAHGSHGAMDQ